MNSKLLSELETALNTGELNPDAVSKVLKKYTKSSNEAGNKLMSILYFIGGGIVFMGIAFWIAQEWDHFGYSENNLYTGYFNRFFYECRSITFA